MRLNILCVLLSVVVVVQCNAFSLLNAIKLKPFDYVQIFKALYGKKFKEFDGVTTSPLTGRTYDWDKCVNEFFEIAGGLSKAEFWAMQCKYFSDLCSRHVFTVDFMSIYQN